MSSTEQLCNLAGIKPHRLSREENIIIEAELFTRLCEKLKEIYQSQYRNYFQLIKFDKDKEIEMLEDNFTRCVINDILGTGEYTITGIANYTHIPEEVVTEIASGQIINPSVVIFRKILELHRSVRGDLYKAIMEKILLEYLDSRQ